MKKRNTKQFEEAKIISETQNKKPMEIRKFNLEARITLKDNQIHLRLIGKDINGKTIYNKIGRSKELSAEMLKQIPSDEQLIGMLDIPFIQGIKNEEEKYMLEFEKVVNDLK